MTGAVESICALCLIGAFLEVLHKNGRHYRVLRFALGLTVIRTLAEILRKII